MRLMSLILLAALGCQTPTAEPTTASVETTAARDARMGWWRQARFGMFIHWGVYAIPGGVWNGKPVWTGGEWIMNGGNIPVADYAALVPQFNPTAWDARAVARLAKNAGMGYIIITAKHHDGFAMWPSKASPFSITATPYGRDPLKDLAEACRTEGIRLGFYYSQSQDWHHPGGTAYPINGRTAANQHWDPAQNGDFDQYLDTIAIPQVRELLTNYGTDVPAVMWWDTPRDMTPARSARLHQVIKDLRPDLITNNRLGGGVQGDTETPEQHIPPQGYPGKDWETCMTMNGSWGYKPSSNDWKSPQVLIRNLADIASKGGNYLLNVGPDGLGRIPEQSVEGLNAMGRWMATNGASIIGTQGTPFGAEAGEYSASEKDKKGKPVWKDRWEWRCTRKPGKLYLHLLTWPAHGTFTAPGLRTAVTKATLLADPAHQPLSVTMTAAGAVITLPATAPDALDTVVVLDLAEAEPHIDQPTILKVGPGTSDTGTPAAAP